MQLGEVAPILPERLTSTYFEFLLTLCVKEVKKKMPKKVTVIIHYKPFTFLLLHYFSILSNVGAAAATMPLTLTEYLPSTTPSQSCK